MSTEKKTPASIDDYIESFPEDVQEVLQKVRVTIRKAAPKAEETISYSIPTFTLNGTYLIYFSGYKKHVSLYPAPIESEEFREELGPYASGRGTAKFPLNKPIPYPLITRIVKFMVQENKGRAMGKAKKKETQS